MMKRLIFWFALGMVAVTAYRAQQSRSAEERRSRAEAELSREFADRHYDRPFLPAVEGAQASEDRRDGPPREQAEGLPVPIVPGTRVEQAEIQPPRPARPARPVRPPAPRRTAVDSAPLPRGVELVKGQLSATEDRALVDARVQLRQKLAEWLAPDVPPSWTVPDTLTRRLIVGEQVKAIDKDYGTVYEASLKVRLTPGLRAEIVEAYRRELVRQRLAVLATALGFILACLAALAGYIRADEATRGYYTNWLRLVAAAGVGAAGTLAYQVLT